MSASSWTTSLPCGARVMTWTYLRSCRSSRGISRWLWPTTPCSTWLSLAGSTASSRWRWATPCLWPGHCTALSLACPSRRWLNTTSYRPRVRKWWQPWACGGRTSPRTGLRPMVPTASTTRKSPATCSTSCPRGSGCRSATTSSSLTGRASRVPK